MTIPEFLDTLWSGSSVSKLQLFAFLIMSEPPPHVSYAPGARRHNDQELEAAILHTAHASLEQINPRILVPLLSE